MTAPSPFVPAGIDSAVVGGGDEPSSALRIYSIAVVATMGMMGSVRRIIIIVHILLLFLFRWTAGGYSSVVVLSRGRVPPPSSAPIATDRIPGAIVGIRVRPWKASPVAPHGRSRRNRHGTQLGRQVDLLRSVRRWRRRYLRMLRRHVVTAAISPTRTRGDGGYATVRAGSYRVVRRELLLAPASSASSVIIILLLVLLLI
mmetsp:Transcript_8714/g.15718  ORF Transcript_8714/g.15718 Transcript_8714/m.15718 type:complete len:201 (-) Transcript_8714:734-1336(-)